MMREPVGLHAVTGALEWSSLTASAAKLAPCLLYIGIISPTLVLQLT